MDRNMNTDQLHRSTLGIYSHLLEEFNPSLHRLVSLGNSYIQAFQGLAVKSEAYFNALSKMGERAFHARSLGDVLVQIAESQRRLTSEMQGIFRWFQAEVLQEMDNNVKMDIDYIAGSKKHYELEVHSQTAALERQHRRGPGQDSGEYLHFLKESNLEALQEEERRYRFLAEKHCGLIQSLTRLMTKTGASLQQRADTWSQEASATRRQEPRRQPMEQTQGREELGSVPLRAPSPERRSRLRSVSDSQGGGGEGGGGARAVRALVSHPASSSNPTLLAFNKGEMITVMVQQPRNGWLYGRADAPSRQGWFPASYVESFDDPPSSPMSRNSSLRSSSGSTMSSSLSQSGSSTQSQAAPPPPPPPPSSIMSDNPPPPPPPSQPSTTSQPQGTSEKKGLTSARPHPELFPRGTNPFATVKLKPTSTNDRSAPKLRR